MSKKHSGKFLYLKKKNLKGISLQVEKVQTKKTSFREWAESWFATQTRGREQTLGITECG